MAPDDESPWEEARGRPRTAPVSPESSALARLPAGVARRCLAHHPQREHREHRDSDDEHAPYQSGLEQPARAAFSAEARAQAVVGVGFERAELGRVAARSEHDVADALELVARR